MVIPFVLALICQTVAGATIRYVKPIASGNGDGSSWDHASADLQAMINASAPGDQVWVAAGTYNPLKDASGNTNPSDARTKTFVMKAGVGIYGGFDGGETSLSHRDWVANQTILSGDIGTLNDDEDNCYHVILNNNNGLTNSAVLDGFTVTQGKANGDTNEYGAGMYNHTSSPTITNCYFVLNSAMNDGGGMYNRESSPTLTNCYFVQNSASQGGGMYNNYQCDLILTNCSFLQNSAFTGAGMYNFDFSTLSFFNCSFSQNIAKWNGGGVYNNANTSANFTNCSFYKNSATLGGGGMYNNGNSSVTLTNCSFSQNSATLGGGEY